MKKVLIIGSGGREHAMGWKISKCKEVSEVIYAPGNAGTLRAGRNINVSGTKKEDFPKILNIIERENIDLTIIGPESSLNEGIVDFLNSKGCSRVFGPTKLASRLESDKFYSYDLMNELNIPQADSVKCFTLDESVGEINKRINQNGIVIKARGLASGKGVGVCDSREHALSELERISKKYGPDILIAERLLGEEFSVFGSSDGNRVSPLEISVQDHKRLLDWDKGPNTGGMGAYCPAPIASKELVRNIVENIMNPLVLEMKSNGNEYKGFLYAGMIMTARGPKVIEFNSRFGDPECQPMMRMLKSDLYNIISSSVEGKLDNVDIEFNQGASCCVVLASRGYPKNNFEQGLRIFGLEEAENIKGIKIFHAGTKLERGRVITNGGRVLGVTSYSPKGILDAQILAYKAVSKINISGGFHYRKDIANKALEFLK